MNKRYVAAAAAGVLVLAIVIALILHARREPLVGRWIREDINPCSVAYPGEIEFLSNGQYVAEGLVAQLGIWRGGGYVRLSSDRVRVDTFDGPATYRLIVQNERATFTNMIGCSISYKRSQ